MQKNVRFKTERLHLRPFWPFDLKALYNAILQSDEIVRPLLYLPNGDFTHEDAEYWIKGSQESWLSSKYFEFAIFDRKTNELTGCAYLSSLDENANMVNLGYWIFGKYQRRGYAYEAAKALVSYAFNDLNLTRIEIVTTPENNASQGLATKLGAIFECKARNRYVYNGVIKDGFLYGLIPSDIKNE